MSEESIEQYQTQQAKESRELEDMLNQMSQLGTAPNHDADLLRLSGLGVAVPKPAEQVVPVAEPTATAVREPAPEAVREIPIEASSSPALAGGFGGDLSEQIEMLKQRKAIADRALAPAQQKAARLEKVVEENNAVLANVLKEINELKNLRATPQAPVTPPAPWYDPALDAEFASENPEVAQRLAFIAQKSREATEQKTKELEERLNAFHAEQERKRTEEQAAQIQNRANLQYAAIKQAHPDVDEYMPGSAKGAELWAWATRPGAPVEYQAIISNPQNFSAEMVITVLGLFKNSINPPQSQRRTPSLADIANPVLANASNSLGQSTVPLTDEYLTPDEMRRADQILNSEDMRTNPEKANAFLAKYVKTEMRNANKV